MNHILKKLILFLFFIFIVFVFFCWVEIYLPLQPSDTEKRLFVIEKGEGLFEISENLQKEGLIRNKYLFNLFVFLKGAQTKLQAGEYLLSPSMNIAGIEEKIVSGDIVVHTIRILEGWNLRDIGWYFENKGMFQAEEFFEVAGFPAADYSISSDLPKPVDFSFKYDFLRDKPKNIGLEGYLFPDTYYIKKQNALSNKQKIEEIIKKMLDNFDKKLTKELRQEIKRQEKTIFEIVTIASLLEKEVRTLQDKKLVSGILWKRLKNDIPLQVDATITYITGKRSTKVSKEETQINSPFNTYKYKGLPLGPICNPGLESILAAVYPEDSEYWYYLSTPEGETIFSKTLEEHNIAKAQHLK